MTDDELTAWEQRIGAGCTTLGKACRVWFTAGDLTKWARARAVTSRVAGGVTATWFVGGIAYAIGPAGWAAAAALAAGSVWIAGGADSAEDQDEEQLDILNDPTAFLELLHDLSGGRNLHLSTVREQLTEEFPGTDWHGPATTALCEAAGVRVRKGVRVPGAVPPVTTGIHRTDLPPLPQPLSDSPVGDVAAGQDDNNNTNSLAEQDSEVLVMVPDMEKGRTR